MKKHQWLALGVLMIFALSAALAGCGSSAPPPAAKKEIVLKAYDNQPADYPTVLGLKFMAKYLEDKSQGRIKMQVYPDGQLGAEKEAIEMTQMGSISISRINTAPLMGFAPQMGVFSMPYLFRDLDHLYKVLEGPIGQKLSKELEKSNLVTLAYYDSGARSFYTKNKAINTPDDAKGQKIRVQQSKVFVDTVNALGGSATPMGYGEVYSALQTGIIDGAENNPPSLFAMKHYEVCKYYALDEHSMVPEIVVMSKKVYDTLSPEDQKLMMEAAREATKEYRKLWTAYTEKSLQELVAKGVVISKPDKEAFRKAVAPMYEKYPEYKEIINEIQAVK
ncbi:MAG: TRAP transporter substrate-binding protein [Negativicutes bacterium]|nr:TRAP transporter substrate-binding protein [Negativicutes bacterium]